MKKGLWLYFILAIGITLILVNLPHSDSPKTPFLFSPLQENTTDAATYVDETYQETYTQGEGANFDDIARDGSISTDNILENSLFILLIVVSSLSVYYTGLFYYRKRVKPFINSQTSVTVTNEGRFSLYFRFSSAKNLVSSLNTWLFTAGGVLLIFSLILMLLSYDDWPNSQMVIAIGGILGSGIFVDRAFITGTKAKQIFQSLENLEKHVEKL